MKDKNITVNTIIEHLAAYSSKGLCTKQGFKEFIDIMEVDSKRYVAADRITSMSVLKNPKLINIWALLNTDDLYETVLSSGIPIDWFAFSICSYVFAVAGFDTSTLMQLFSRWQGNIDATSQKYYNEFISIALNRLAVFYD